MSLVNVKLKPHLRVEQSTGRGGGKGGSEKQKGLSSDQCSQYNENPRH